MNVSIIYDVIFIICINTNNTKVIVLIKTLKEVLDGFISSNIMFSYEILLLKSPYVKLMQHIFGQCVQASI